MRSPEVKKLNEARPMVWPPMNTNNENPAAVEARQKEQKEKEDYARKQEADYNKEAKPVQPTAVPASAVRPAKTEATAKPLEVKQPVTQVSKTSPSRTNEMPANVQASGNANFKSTPVPPKRVEPVIQQTKQQ